MAHPFGVTGYMPPTAPDKRNFPLEKAQAVQPFPASYKTDISALPIFDQQKIPDCVENSITYVKKYHIYKNYNLSVDLSRRFLAAWTVIRDGFSLDNGTSVENALYEAHKRGICESAYLADDHSLSVDVFANAKVLTAAADANGQKHTIQSYAFVTDLSANGLKNAIYQNAVVVVGALINQNWWTDRSGNISWDANDILPIRPPATRDRSVDTSLSGHAFVLYGYDDQYIYFVNSFGTEWGQNGLGYFSINEIPFIYEAATIVDLKPEVVAAIKQQTAEVVQVVETIKPTDVNYAQELTLVQRIVAAIAAEIKVLLGDRG